MVAVQYLAEHHEKILTVVESFSENDAVSIAVAKELLSSSTVIREVFFINKNIGCLVEAMKKIGADQKLESVLTVLEFVNINLGDPIAAEKFREILEGNAGFQILKAYSERTEISSPLGNWSVQDLARIGDVPVQNCSVERTFSSYKDVLSDRRHNLLKKNLKKTYFVCVTQIEFKYLSKYSMCCYEMLY